jgi:hypothetical protein
LKFSIRCCAGDAANALRGGTVPGWSGETRIGMTAAATGLSAVFAGAAVRTGLGFRGIRTAPTARHNMPVETRAIQMVVVRNFIAS